MIMLSETSSPFCKLTEGLLPRFLLAPALPSTLFLFCGLLTAPMVARHFRLISRCSPAHTQHSSKIPFLCYLQDKTHMLVFDTSTGHMMTVWGTLD
jgi:hypothetical protein